jgi:hypothetical protein
MGQTPKWCEHGQLWAQTGWLENVGHKDDPGVLADRVTQVFYVFNPETVKYVVVSGN